jgi:hypothetical protein
VTTAKRPSCRDGTAVNKSLIWVERQAEWIPNIFRKRARHKFGDLPDGQILQDG